jgi:hypothetical protein
MMGCRSGRIISFSRFIESNRGDTLRSTPDDKTRRIEALSLPSSFPSPLNEGGWSCP